MAARPDVGILSLESLAGAIRAGDVETVLVAFPDMYGRLVGKRLTARHFVHHAAEAGIHVCDYLLACDMEMDPVPGYPFANWDSGYGDLHAVPDLGTLRRAAWLPQSAIVLCDLYHDDGDRPAEPAPRHILARQIERAAEQGLRLMAGSELELYLFQESYEEARARGYVGLSPAGAYIEDYHLLQGSRHEPVMGAIRRGLEASGIPVEGTKGEWGAGQQELNLEYCAVMAQADRTAIAKHAAHDIALAEGNSVTFMAKWHQDHAGSSMHVHLSLWDVDAPDPVGPGSVSLGPVMASERFRWFLGGMIEHAGEITAFLAPNVSSYKRFQSGTFAPVNLAWSHDNRTAAFRVVGAGPTLRIECRIPGADANPYLVYATLLAAGLDGIERRCEPPPPVSGDLYLRPGLSRLPGTLGDAIQRLEAGSWARSALGDPVIDHYLHFFRTEQSKFDAVVTDWERCRFFERV